MESDKTSSLGFPGESRSKAELLLSDNIYRRLQIVIPRLVLVSTFVNFAPHHNLASCNYNS